REVNARLVAIESHAIRFAGEGREQEGLDLLVGPEYLELKRRMNHRLVEAIDRMRVEEARADREGRARRTVGLSLALGSIPAVILVWLLLLRGVRRWSLDRRRAEAQRREAEEERRRLLAHIVRAQEEERRRIAADIHDDSIQALTAVSLRIDVLRRTAPETIGLDHLAQTVDEAIRRLRSLMFELHPRVLDRDGLGPAIHESLRQASEESGFIFELDDRLGIDLPMDVRVTGYRIVREAIANIRKHARASRVRVELTARDGSAFIVVADDGVGFSANGASDSPLHLGLSTMRERAELTGGRLDVDSLPGHGTTVRVAIPISGGEAAPERQAPRAS
ncbi:MAG TPA: sensor histidine kinase, partial [Actinomycetota bacterium]|nr:sensor histidine kinase [Actinomycetota bacterium]